MKTIKAAWCIVVLGIVGLAVSPDLQAQDKPDAVMESEDLGDGFRAVSVNGGPPAIIDDETGLIFKMAYGHPVVVDQQSGMLLYMDDNGEAKLKAYAKVGSGKEPDSRTLKRMKTYLKKAQSYRNAYMDRKGSKKKAHKKKRPEPTKTESRLAMYLKLLDVTADESAVIKPLLEAVLSKQDELRRSTVDLAPRRWSSKKSARVKKAYPSKKAWFAKKSKKTSAYDLPPAIQTYLRTFKALRAGKAVDEVQLRKSLAAFRAARKKQAAELATLREKLREVLSVIQEAKLTAVGVLD